MATKKPNKAKNETNQTGKPAKLTKLAKTLATETPPKGTKTKAEALKKLSALDAAARILGEIGQGMNSKELIDQMAAKGYWTSPGGQTPHATLHAAISREIKVKEADSRFAKAGPGKYTARGKA
jgi:hypothetical protein